MITGVFDHVPEDAARPYITLGPMIETPDNTHSGYGRQAVLDVHIWTEARGYLTGNQIADRVVALLDHQRLTMPGRKWISTRYEFGQALPDPDPRIRHHLLRFRITSMIIQEV
ncbi:DUF3168 domain-containing protein [Parafrankia sp. EUN1f]|uniref:DUF3168 domain-containing protein n=1 Tax=Parafrankia sp. EUN1f TaxID=102897 RepID=UPI0001C4530A|nr:DUF3168 domain-containing protein [Parafrankia sp. EUN1f]EFC78982.1 hypothetical protein FrEUN1fDRAFT_7899 [Parafrankia sp. EUN1f]